MIEEEGNKTSTPNRNTVGYWRKQLHAARERVKAYRKDAEEVVKIYEAKDKKQGVFNILYSNTETLLPALYNVTPRPDVQRRYKDEDPVGKLAAEALERGLSYYIDCPDRLYTPFDDLMSHAVVSTLVPGQGITRFKYDAQFSKADKPTSEEKEGPADTEGDLDGEQEILEEAGKEPGQADEEYVGPGPVRQHPMEEMADKVAYETVCGEAVQWNRFLTGPAAKWAQTPWIAFEHRMTKTEVAASFGKSWMEKLPFEEMDADDEREGSKTTEEEKKPSPVCVIQEIWHKRTKRVLFICENYAEGPIKNVEDPYGISGFFPLVEPLQFSVKVSNQVPIPLYRFYEQQARELNELTRRISKITNAIKVRGFYDAGIGGDIKDLLTKEDDVLLPASFVATMKEGATPENSIWLLPIDKLIVVLQQLVMQRQQVKQVIYEITGISDILRGSSVASETATAQNIKNQWGTLRLKRLQKKVQAYVRNNLRLVSELMAEKYGEDTWAKTTMMKVQSSQEKQQAMQALQQAQQQMQATPPEQQQQMMQQLQPQIQAAQAPSWGDIVGLLQDDLTRNYHIDIETNSTVDPEAVEDKQAIAELMQALGTLSQTMGASVQQGILPLGAYKAMMLAITRRYSFGPELEDQLSSMPDQMPKPPEDPKVKEQEMKLQVVQAEAQATQQKLQGQMQFDQAELKIKMKELELKERELALKDKEMAQKEQLNEVKFKGQLQAAEAKSAMAAATAMMPPQPAQPNPNGGLQPTQGPVQ